jgi:hypothetical protein
VPRRARRLPVEDGEKVGGWVDRQLGRELEEVPIPGHQSGVLVGGQRDEVGAGRLFHRLRRNS